ncbi:MAG: transcription elongation factor GreA [Gammaproteobacteria bacterium RIFCSPHIGHO2_12_FULL_35_23]|nr:MAG: transcription elongation factor GreA [Gammaproteobacteria bacterium RIFCSPHIGHO2_12_FULL_35_23]
MEREPMTILGKQRLEDELKNLKSVERPRIISAIAEARAHGDLKENAEYHAAKEQQGFTEGRIAEIESKLARAQVIDVTKMVNEGKVIFGSTVDLLNIDNEETIIYKIVGDDEADLGQGKISYKAPIARALIGKHVDDTVEFKAPNGLQRYEIVEVRYE